MTVSITRKDIKNELVDKIELLSGQNVFECYQCGNCSSGCPMVDYMDYTPNQVMRLAQTGAIEELLAAGTMWVCAACLQCSSRCPKGIDVAGVMEALRTINLRNRVGVITPDDISTEDRRELPPIVLVSAFRKLSG
ncbi:MAG: 4Fe-4S dicluster domain-containing protein [Candidatus Cloacimonetes bacterium]|nr:4Fe-4S dicluster domain-containing protein [Candidatus Cloacimonadota bacterium]